MKRKPTKAELLKMSRANWEDTFTRYHVSVEKLVADSADGKGPSWLNVPNVNRLATFVDIAMRGAAHGVADNDAAGAAYFAFSAGCAYGQIIEAFKLAENAAAGHHAKAIDKRRGRAGADAKSRRAKERYRQIVRAVRALPSDYRKASAICAALRYNHGIIVSERTIKRALKTEKTFTGKS